MKLKYLPIQLFHARRRHDYADDVIHATTVKSSNYVICVPKFLLKILNCSENNYVPTVGIWDRN